ncbi:MAG: hypothetical protein U0487_01795 [Patescibacteria group bacterium]
MDTAKARYNFERTWSKRKNHDLFVAHAMAVVLGDDEEYAIALMVSLFNKSSRLCEAVGSYLKLIANDPGEELDKIYKRLNSHDVMMGRFASPAAMQAAAKHFFEVVKRMPGNPELSEELMNLLDD